MHELESSQNRMSKKERLVAFATKIRSKIRGVFNGVADRVAPKRHEKKEEEQQLQDTVYTRAVERSKNWRQLYQAITLIDSIPTSASDTNFRAVDVKKRIFNAYHSNHKVLNKYLVPSAYGLRDKYVELVAQPVEAVAPIDSDTDITLPLPKVDQYIFHNNFAILDPEKYQSKTVDAAVDEITVRFHALSEKKQTMQSLILLAANVVDEVMPYDYIGRGRAADTFNQITQIIEADALGVCRHQAPFLYSILNRLGFDAHHVWHDWQGSIYAHTLVYIADTKITAFINPGSSDRSTTFVPAREYPTSAMHWRMRDEQNQWQPAPQFESEQKKHRPASRIISKLVTIFTGKKSLSTFVHR